VGEQELLVDVETETETLRGYSPSWALMKRLEKARHRFLRNVAFVVHRDTEVGGIASVEVEGNGALLVAVAERIADEIRENLAGPGDDGG
jgi:hypothetical protein